MQMTRKLKQIAAFSIAAVLLVSVPVQAHCDSEDGPIIPSIRQALDDGDITPLLKWIAPEDEQEITDLFERVRKIRTESAAVREIADRHFIETFIRIHRASEGAPYTGIKPAGSMPPVFAAADDALEQGSVDALADKVASAVREQIIKRFSRANKLSKRQDESVAAGREYVEAYVTYVHFVEGLHSYLQEGSTAHHETEGGHGH